MKKQWRPDEWDNPCVAIGECPQNLCSPLGHAKIYEAGADAMLEALRKSGQRFGAAHNPFTGEWREAFIQVNIPEGVKNERKRFKTSSS